jgi:exopolyphosphatase/pppGpp-phosphohydrolase
LQVVIEWLWSSTRAERQLNPAIAVRRVDWILTEAVIVEAIMQRFNFQELYISSWGLRHGALLAASQ